MAFKSLKEHWKNQGISHALGASRSDISEFEARHGVKLPDDIRKYFSDLNGFSELSAKENDDRGFRFLSLDAVRHAQDAIADLTGDYPILPEPGTFFVFAEFLQWSWGYAILLSKNAGMENIVIPIGKHSYPIIATSFENFIYLYLKNDKRIYAG